MELSLYNFSEPSGIAERRNTAGLSPRDHVQGKSAQRIRGPVRQAEDGDENRPYSSEKRFYAVTHGEMTCSMPLRG